MEKFSAMRITQARPISRHGERGGKRGTTKEIPAYRWQLPDRVTAPITSSQDDADIVTEGYFWPMVGGHLAVDCKQTSSSRSTPLVQAPSLPPAQSRRVLLSRRIAFLQGLTLEAAGGLGES